MAQKENIDKTIKVNLLNKDDNKNPKGKKIFKVSRLILYLFIVLFTVFAVFTFQVILSGGKNASFQNFNFFKNVGQMIKGYEDQVIGEQDDRINILLLGNGGSGHDGPNLTDTIMLISIKPSENRVAMMSVPRDLLVPLPDFGQGKINNAYAFAEAQTNGTGGIYTTKVVSDVLDIDIPYFVRVDFDGFESLVNDLDGIDVYVDRSFTDYQYPAPNDKYQVVRFEEGWQTMDGDTALKYVRSRHGNNGESGDFARSKRQQKVLEAVQKKTLSYKTFLSPKKISKVMETLSENISTNLEIWEIVHLAKIAQEVDMENVSTLVLDDSPNGLLYGTKYGEAFVLKPKSENFSDIRFAAENIFLKEQAIEQKETAKIEIKNGTGVNGLASRTSDKFTSLGYEVIKIGNAPSQDYETTELYDLTGGEKSGVTGVLETILKAKKSEEIPDWIKKLAAPGTDFYIILGADNKDL
ncbi:MAG TPA: LCP family protein [Candidatus Bipolaricaulota bacterium]|nr:LCP family protein [Candidatus Bipolaricaulota bacterium]